MPQRTSTNLQKLRKYQQIDSDVLCISDGSLFCSLCNTRVSHERKSLVVQHLSTQIHKSNAHDNNHETQGRLDFTKKNVLDSCFEGFTMANIPLYKFRSPAIIKMFRELGVDSPAESSLRNKVNSAYENFMTHLRLIFENKMFFLILDASQIGQRKFVNVLIGLLETPNKVYLAEVREINEPPNSKNQAIIVDDVIKDLNLSRNNFYLFISDAASYMLLCAKNLKHFYPNMCHITCFAQLCR